MALPLSLLRPGKGALRIELNVGRHRKYEMMEAGAREDNLRPPSMQSGGTYFAPRDFGQKVRHFGPGDREIAWRNSTPFRQPAELPGLLEPAAVLPVRGEWLVKLRDSNSTSFGCPVRVPGQLNLAARSCAGRLTKRLSHVFSWREQLWRPVCNLQAVSDWLSDFFPLGRLRTIP
jgi:hypothetical protein